MCTSLQAAVTGEAETEDTQAEEACGGKQDEMDPTGSLGTEAAMPKDASCEDTEETTGDAQEDVQSTSRKPEGDTEPTDDTPAAEPMEDGREELEHAGSSQESKEPEMEAQEEKKAESSPNAKADHSGEGQEEMEVSKESEASKGEQADVSKGKRERSSGNSPGSFTLTVLKPRASLDSVPLFLVIHGMSILA